MKPTDAQQRKRGVGDCTFEGCDQLVLNKKTQLCAGHYWKRRMEQLNLECTTEKCNNLVYNQKWLVCRYHYGERIAQNHLKAYINGYESPFPQNQLYFAQVASMIDLSDVANGTVRVCVKDVSRYRAFGELLKVYELPKQLTWSALVEAWSRLGKRSRSTLIRSCLCDLGQFYAERGLMPDWKSYLAERWLQQSLMATPAIFREYVLGFQQWALDGMTNPRLQLSREGFDPLTIKPKTIIHRVTSVNGFMTWCLPDKIASLEDVNSTLISDYCLTLFWKWECRKCGKSFPLCPYETPATCLNKDCEATNNFAQVRNLARSTVRDIISHLRVFFTWAHLQGFITHNPIGDKRMIGSRTFTFVDKRDHEIGVASAIRCYDDWVLKKLCAYIVSSDADPDEALILYLVIFHLFTLPELCSVKIASLVKGGTPGSMADYRYVFLPFPERSKGRRSSQRPKETIKFPRTALPWLTLLLERFYGRRRTCVKAPHNQYLIAVAWTRHNKPASESYVTSIVRRSSLRLLGGTINILDLRRTSARVFSCGSKRRAAVLTRMGYNEKGATRFNYLETFSIKPRSTAGVDRTRRRR
jgi:hypothetical protein